VRYVALLWGRGRWVPLLAQEEQRADELACKPDTTTQTHAVINYLSRGYSDGSLSNESVYRPYQRALLEGLNLIRPLNFEALRDQYTARSQVRKFFLDSNHNIYRDGTSQFVCEVEQTTGGLVTRRLGQMLITST
jgi:hypothetical protein